MTTDERVDSLDEMMEHERDPFRARSASAEDVPSDRLGAVWKGKWWILAATVVAAIVTFAVTQVVPKTYESTAQVTITAGVSDGGADTGASNNLAAQYAQLVTSRPVVASAAAQSNVSTDALTAAVSSGTVAGQNIVEITVQADGSDVAEARANAMAESLTKYVTSSGSAQASRYNASLQRQLAPLNLRISQLQNEVNSATSALVSAARSNSAARVSAANARLNSAQSLLTTLVDRQQNLQLTAGLRTAAATATAQQLGAPSSASVAQPRPLLYTLVAALVVLAISIQLTVTLAERRRRLGVHRAGR